MEETRLQTSLNDSYHEMGEKAFKGLRRALPLTRQKIDWDKVCIFRFLQGLFTDRLQGDGIQAWRRAHGKQRRICSFIVNSVMVCF